MNTIKIVKNKNSTTFEDIKHIDENGYEYWYARELMHALEYTKWGNFNNVIAKAKLACELSKNNIDNHFANVGKTIKMPKGATKIIDDYELSRYACYLIAQNGDSRKETIALAQTYFAIQTRKQELSEMEYDNLPEIEKRFYQRNITKQGNYLLKQRLSYKLLTKFSFYKNYI